MYRSIKYLSITCVLVIVSSLLILFLWPIPPLLNGMSYSRAVYDKDHHLLRLTLSLDGKYRLYVPLSDISESLQKASLLQEDQYFYQHIGFNPVSLIKAGWYTYVLGKRRVGASTITMQVVRMRYGIHSKRIFGKMIQIVRALQLELHYRKNEILEAYLNLAPFGNNIEGVGAASLLYFNQSARELSLPNALTLVGIPQNPNKRSVNLKILQHARQTLYFRWLKKFPQDRKIMPLMQLPIQMHKLHQAPFFAPHFVNQLLTNQAIQQNEIVSTLVLPMQQMLERLTHHYLARQSVLNVNNAAVMLVDTRDMSVKALLGSANFFARDISGQINGSEISRSPGSTLKPFIYALALEQGLIHPGTMLKDVPRSFGSYNPENFDHDFIGPIKARDALVLSRNIPAIYLAEQLKHPSLYEFLQSAGIKHLKSENYYGLALVLGGLEMTMQELVALYAMLANQGVLYPLRFTQTKFEKLPRQGERLLSREASFLVLEMLQKKDVSFPLFLKTGTSSGYRDAWTIGMVGPYVLAVWIGNFNNQSNPALIGKEIAAPLFKEIAQALVSQFGPFSSILEDPSKMHLTKIPVCKISGMLPTTYCRDREEVWFIPGKSPIHRDTIHREIALDKKTGLRTCHFNENTRFEVYEFWPSDILAIFKRAGIERRLPPPYAENCLNQLKMDSGVSPFINSPNSQLHYIARIQSKTTIIPFTAVVDADVKFLYWFLNTKFLGKTLRNETLFWRAHSGSFTVRVVDDHGRSDTRDINITSI